MGPSERREEVASRRVVEQVLATGVAGMSFVLMQLLGISMVEAGVRDWWGSMISPSVRGVHPHQMVRYQNKGGWAKGIFLQLLTERGGRTGYCNKAASENP